MQVKVAEGRAPSTLNARGSFLLSTNHPARGISTSIGAFLSVPIYSRALVFKIRQAKELLGQARIQVDVNRELVRSSTSSRPGAPGRCRGEIQAFQAAVNAQGVALAGVREEAKVGPAHHLRRLAAAAIALAGAGASLIQAQRDR